MYLLPRAESQLIKIQPALIAWAKTKMLPFIPIYFAISAGALLVATFTDLKERLVSNKLTYGLAIIGLLLKGAESYYAGSLMPLEVSIAGGVIGFAAAYVLYMLGVWAGGDVKLVAALSFVNPINYAALAWILPAGISPFGNIALPVFSISLIISSALMVFPIGIAMSIGAALGHKNILAQTLKAVRSKALGLLGAAALVSGTRIILQWISIQNPGVFGFGVYAENLIDFISLAALLLAAFAPKNIGKYAAIVLGAAGIALSPSEFIFSGFAVAIPLLVVYAIWKLYSESREVAFKETIPVSKISEGMIPDKYVVLRGKKIEFVEGPSIKTVIKQLISNKMQKALGDFHVDGKVLSSPREAGGISAKAAQELKEKAELGLAPKTISVRKTMAFVPAILAAYIALQIAGDILWFVIFYTAL